MNKDKKIYSWMNPKLVIKKTSKYGLANLPFYKNGKKKYKSQTGEGWGVFAKESLKKNDVLFVMGGYILDINDENSLKGIVADKPIEISENFSIGPRTAKDIEKMPQHYVNHSCNPNAGFDGQIFMTAIRPIRQNEEIAYDYAMIMHSNTKSNSYFTFDCLCGTEKCRGTISEDDWKMKDLQKQYDGYFQYFIQKKINGINK